MVGVAQSVELRIVIPAVEGSSPFAHPIFLRFVVGAAEQSLRHRHLCGIAMGIVEEGHAGFN